MLQLYGDNLLCQMYKQWCGDHANPAHFSHYDGKNQRIVDTTHMTFCIKHARFT
jgi:hypothetical protein